MSSSKIPYKHFPCSCSSREFICTCPQAAVLYLWVSTFQLWNSDLDFSQVFEPVLPETSSSLPAHWLTSSSISKICSAPHWLDLFTGRKTHSTRLSNATAKEGYGNSMDCLVKDFQAPFPQALPNTFSTYLHRGLVHSAWSRTRMAKGGRVRNWW